MNHKDRKHSGSTPLHVAAARSNARIVGMLVEAGANIHIPDDNGVTPMDVAARRGSRFILESLSPRTRRREQKRQTDDNRACTPLHVTSARQDPLRSCNRERTPARDAEVEREGKTAATRPAVPTPTTRQDKEIHSAAKKSPIRTPLSTLPSRPSLDEDRTSRTDRTPRASMTPQPSSSGTKRDAHEDVTRSERQRRQPSTPLSPTSSEVSIWLHRIGMNRYVDVFDANGLVSLPLVAAMKVPDDLRKLGVANAHTQKVLGPAILSLGASPRMIERERRKNARDFENNLGGTHAKEASVSSSRRRPRVDDSTYPPWKRSYTYVRESERFAPHKGGWGRMYPRYSNLTSSDPPRWMDDNGVSTRICPGNAFCHPPDGWTWCGPWEVVQPSFTHQSRDMSGWKYSTSFPSLQLSGGVWLKPTSFTVVRQRVWRRPRKRRRSMLHDSSHDDHGQHNSVDDEAYPRRGESRTTDVRKSLNRHLEFMISRERDKEAEENSMRTGSDSHVNEASPSRTPQRRDSIVHALRMSNRLLLKRLKEERARRKYDVSEFERRLATTEKALFRARGGAAVADESHREGSSLRENVDMSHRTDVEDVRKDYEEKLARTTTEFRAALARSIQAALAETLYERALRHKAEAALRAAEEKLEGSGR